jgi:L-threonylcarbamoyladenylate synthase
MPMSDPMTVVAVATDAPDPAVLAHAARLLRSGQLVAFPTETVYGLGANALDAGAVARIFGAKGRPAYNPLIVHVADEAAARRLVTSWPASATALAHRWWPGPLTLVLPKAIDIPDLVTAGLPTVALRVPSHPVALALLRATGLPLAAPSANRSGEVSPTTAQHVLRSLGARVPLILDAGPTSVGIESTVVDLSGPTPVLLRPGMISREALAEVLGPVAVAASAVDPLAPRPSPGMLDRHYAPRALVVLYDEPDSPAILQAIADCRAGGGRSAALARGPAPAGVDQVVLLPAEPMGYARELYGALHRVDATGVSLVLVERPPRDPTWDAVRDRLDRAARP